MIRESFTTLQMDWRSGRRNVSTLTPNHSREFYPQVSRFLHSKVKLSRINYFSLSLSQTIRIMELIDLIYFTSRLKYVFKTEKYNHLCTRYSFESHPPVWYNFRHIVLSQIVCVSYTKRDVLYLPKHSDGNICLIFIYLNNSW